MTIRQKRIRNVKIYEAFLTGESKTDLAHRYNLTFQQVFRIIKAIDKNPQYKQLLQLERDLREKEARA